mgnify:CR=1 FL=1
MCISIHAPTRGATIRGCFMSKIEIISIHAPTRGATTSAPFSDREVQFQSTLPQGERHRLGEVVRIDNNFNPRSHKGSDISLRTFAVFVNDFNPRSHKGSDTASAKDPNSTGISIHAPTRGATVTSGTGYDIFIFQSTLPQGERRHTYFTPPFHPDFNPRSHKGSDENVMDKSIEERISIHAPTRGATPTRGIPSGMSTISIHAPTRGATITHKPDHSLMGISIHAPTRGATSEGQMTETEMNISIHAPTRGATQR